MRLGIDFGTTHTVIALVDRGNYPIASFEWGDAFPSVIAIRARDGEVRYGHDAEEVASDPEFTMFRSFKRLVQDAGPLSELVVGATTFRIAELFAGYLARLKKALLEESNAGLEGETLEAAVSVPAHATSDQRFLTLDAFRRAGFEVLALLNEPSAAGFEYGHRFRRTLTSRREHVLVYDLGGGTFDASLVHMSGLANEVVASAGIARLGGDDFDAAILALALAKAGVGPIDEAIRPALLEQVRHPKEALVPQSRKLVVDLSPIGHEPITLSLEDVNEVCAPLVDRTLAVIDSVLSAPRGTSEEGLSAKDLAGLYVVGGASSLPLVGKRLREIYGQPRVKRSPHPHAATAIGLACFLDEGAGFTLTDCLTRHFGVFRETDGGREVSFDPIFAKDTKLPSPREPEIVTTRRYRPMHDIGRFRFVECTELRDGRPDGLVSPWDDVVFAFDPALRDHPDLATLPAQRFEREGPEIEERFECDASGLFRVTLTCLEDGYARSYRIARHSHL